LPIVVVKRLSRRKNGLDNCPSCNAELKTLATFVPSLLAISKAQALELPDMDGYKLADSRHTMELSILECPQCGKFYETHETLDYDWWSSAEIDRTKLTPLTVNVIVCDRCGAMLPLKADLTKETACSATKAGLQNAQAAGWKHPRPDNDYCPQCAGQA